MKLLKTNGLKTLPKPTDPDCDGERKLKGFNQNTGVLSNPTFLKACERVGIEPTRRQASKWSKGRGKAFRG